MISPNRLALCRYLDFLSIVDSPDLLERSIYLIGYTDI